MSYGMDRQVIETRAAQRDLEECTDHAENLTLKVSDLKKQLAVSRKKLRSAQLCLEELTQRAKVLRKERDIARRKAQHFKKDTLLLQEDIADILEETAECDVSSTEDEEDSSSNENFSFQTKYGK